MKIRIDFDVSPEELRTFFGLPDVKPLQEDMLEKVREGLSSGSAGLDAIGMMAPYLAPNLQAMEGFQRALWQAFTQQRPASREDQGGEG